MIAVLRGVGGLADFRVVVPAAPMVGDVIEAQGATWRVTDRRFRVPAEGESEVVVRVERVEVE